MPASSSAAQPAPTSAEHRRALHCGAELERQREKRERQRRAKRQPLGSRTRASIPARSGSRIHAPFITLSPPSAQLPSSLMQALIQRRRRQRDRRAPERGSPI